MENVQDMTLIGFYHFSSKDKTKHYYVVQALTNELNVSNSTNKATVIDIFVSDEIYNSILNKEIGEPIKVQMTPNLSTGKIGFKLCL